MKIDISPEIRFRTARSGGKGGQNVNKLETMVEGLFEVDGSQLISFAQKQLVKEKLRNRITKDGYLLVKSQSERTQLGNKQQVIEKMNHLMNEALVKKKLRIATKPSQKSKETRIESKKKNASVKQNRQKIRSVDY
jgi:ribosome-associated protein